jgi:hypothetical protein
MGKTQGGTLMARNGNLRLHDVEAELVYACSLLQEQLGAGLSREQELVKHLQLATLTRVLSFLRHERSSILDG